RTPPTWAPVSAWKPSWKTATTAAPRRCRWSRSRAVPSRRWRGCTPAALTEDFDQRPRLEARGFSLVRVSARIAHHPRFSDLVVELAVQMAVEPQPRAGHQRLIVIAEARRRRLLAVARVRAADAGGEVSDCHRRIPIRS